MSRGRFGRLFWIGAAVTLVAAALVAIVSVLRGRFTDTDGRILLTLVTLMYAGGSGLAGLALAGRGGHRTVGALGTAAAPVGLGFMLFGIWSFAWEESSDTADRLAWSWVLVLAASLVATTSFLWARTASAERLAAGAGLLASLAAGLTTLAVWWDDAGGGFGKALAAIWILTVLAYFLVPVLQRFGAAGAAPAEARVIAALGGVELIATRSPRDGLVVEPRLRPGERLVLRARV